MEWDAESDAKALRAAMKGGGTDEAELINVLGRRSRKHLQEVATKFKVMYGKDLDNELKSEISGNFLKLCLAMLTSEPDFDAQELRAAMKGLGTTEETLIEIICTRTNQEIQAIKHSFNKLFDRDLEEDIVSETSGCLQRILVSLLQGARDESVEVDANLIEEDYKTLYNAGDGQTGTDESMFNMVLASRSREHLKELFKYYEATSDKSIFKVISSEFSGNIKKALTSIVKCTTNKDAYFAEVLYNSMAGLGTSDDQLIRVVITRKEIDLPNIKSAFLEQYESSLEDFMKGDTGGDYQKMLLALIGGEE